MPFLEFRRMLCVLALGAWGWSSLMSHHQVAAQVESTPVSLEPWMDYAVDPIHRNDPFAFDPAAYQTSPADLPIGIFDSGIGGLTVLNAILKLDAFDNRTLQPGADGRPDFENESFLYLGDQANMPYGNYSAVGKVDFLRELILKDAIFLLGNRYWPSSQAMEPRFDKPGVKAIVIACNTATAYGLEDLKQAQQRWGLKLPIIGVVEAGARGVNEEVCRVDRPVGVAILATVGTCSSQAYPKTIQRVAGMAGKRIPIVWQQGSVELAGAIEGDPTMLDKKKPLTQSQAITELIRDDLIALLEARRESPAIEEKEPPPSIEALVLGCTHFPLVAEEIDRVLAELREHQVEGRHPYRHLLGPSTKLIDPADLTARELFRDLARLKLRRTTSPTDKAPSSRFFVSVPNLKWPALPLTSSGQLTDDYKYGRVAGRWIDEDTRFTPLTLEQLAVPSRQLIEQRLPLVWEQLQQAMGR